MKYLIIGGVAGGATVAAGCVEWTRKRKSSFSNVENMFLTQTVDYLII